MDLAWEWKRVLLIYPMCRADGALSLARTRRRNGAANGRCAQRACLATIASSLTLDADFTPVEATNGEVYHHDDSVIGPRVISRGRRSQPSEPASRSRRATSRRVAGA